MLIVTNQLTIQLSDGDVHPVSVFLYIHIIVLLCDKSEVDITMNGDFLKAISAQPIAGEAHLAATYSFLGSSQIHFYSCVFMFIYMLLLHLTLP